MFSTFSNKKSKKGIPPYNEFILQKVIGDYYNYKEEYFFMTNLRKNSENIL